MSELAATQIPKPSDEQAFERCNRTLWRCILKDDSVKTYGRRGQRQYGVDLTGIRENAPGKIVGVQCKLKSVGKKLKEDEVKNEVEKALNFKPLLSEYHIVTTAPDDATMENLALELSDSISKVREKNLKVRVWGWNSLEIEIRDHPRAIKAFDPSHTAQGDRLEKKIDSLADVINRSLNPVITDTSAYIEVEHLINECVELISTIPDTALNLFKKFQNSLRDDADSTIRFRIANNIAACQLKLGEEKSAAQAFISAYEIDPNNPKAIANKALGLLLQDDWPVLKKFAETQLPKSPDNAALAAYFIQGMSGDNAIEDPLVHVPETVRETPEVLEAHVRWLVNRGEHGAWWDPAIVAHQKHPDYEALRDLYADAVLDRLLDGGSMQFGRSFNSNERADIEAAIDTYHHRWEQIRNSTQNKRAESKDIPLNLMLAHNMLHQHDKSLVIGEQALNRFDGDPEVKQYIIATLIEVGNFEHADNLLSELEAEDKLEIDSRAVMMWFNIYVAKNDWLAVSELVSAHYKVFPEPERDLALATQVRANVELASIDRRRTILETELDNFQGDTRALIVLASAARIHQFDDLTSVFFKAGLDAIKCGDNGYASRVSLAREAANRGEYSITADMLAGQVELDRDSSELRLLAESLVQDLPIRDRAVKFFEDLAPEIRCLFFFQKAEGFLHSHRGAPSEAVPLFTAVFETERCAENLMYLIHTHYSADDRDAIDELIRSSDINTLSGAPLERLNLYQVLLDFGKSQNVLDMGYQALIDGMNDAEVVMKYIGLVLMANEHRTSGGVASGKWVRFTSKNGDVHEVLLDEAADRPWGQKADTSNAYYKKALGLKSGDEFTYINPTTGLSDTWIVSEVKPRWLQAFDHMSMNFSQRFPEARGFASVPMPEGDIEPVLELVRLKSEKSHRTANELANLYLFNNFPLAIIAGYMPGGSIALAEHLVSNGEGLRVCIGSNDETNEALELIKTNDHSGAVLDALTAWYAAYLGVLSVLENQLGPLVIPATDFNYLQSMLNDSIGVVDKEMMSITYRDGNYYRHIITPEDHAIQREIMKSRIEAIKEICDVESVVIPDNLSDVGKQFMEPPFSEAVSPAIITGQDRLLICDDMAMRQLARSVFDTKSVWLQVVLWSALRDGTMTLDHYSDALVKLTHNRHGFVQVSAPVLLSVFVRDKTNDLIDIQALCNYLGGENAEPTSNILVATQFINTLWINCPTDENKVRTATQIMLRALLTKDSKKQDQYVTGLATLLNQQPKEYLLKWCHENGVTIDGASTLFSV